MQKKTYNISTTDAGRWYCFCAEVPISVTWEDKDFVETQEWDYTGEADELAIAREARELTEWLAKEHQHTLAVLGAEMQAEGEPLDEPVIDWTAVELTLREDVGRMINALRHERGLTQAELGEMAGLSKNHICRIEAGRYNVTIDTLARILYALGADIDFPYVDDDDYFDDSEA